MLSRFTAATTILSLGILASAQAWPGSTYAIHSEFGGNNLWLFASQSLGVSGVEFWPALGFFEWNEWVIQSAENATDPSTQVTFFNSIAGFATPGGGDHSFCLGQEMGLRTILTDTPHVWDLTPVGNDQYMISTNVTTPNSGGKPTRVFWTVDAGAIIVDAGPVSLEQEGFSPCPDSRGITQVWRFSPPSVLNGAIHP